jgi:hypothetical protein
MVCVCVCVPFFAWDKLFGTAIKVRRLLWDQLDKLPDSHEDEKILDTICGLLNSCVTRTYSKVPPPPAKFSDPRVSLLIKISVAIHEYSRRIKIMVHTSTSGL